MDRSPSLPRRPRRRRRLARPALLASALLALAAPPAARPARAADPVAPAAPPARSVGEVSITATRAERGALETPGHVSVITREDIERSGVRDLPELLRREAGIYVTNTTTNPEGYNVEARGFQNGGGNGSSTLVLVNGRRVNEPDSSTTDWALLHLDEIERVEIVRGPASAVHGDNAVGGVIHVFTRQGEGPPRFSLQGRVGSHDTAQGSLFAGGSAGPVSASFFADRLHSDGYRDGSGMRSRAFDATLRFALGERVSLGFSGGYGSDTRGRPGTLSAAEIAAGGRDERDPSFLRAYDDARQRWLQGDLDVALAEGARLRVQPFHRARVDHAEQVTTSFGFETDSEKVANGVNTQLQLDGRLGGLANRLLLGADLLREDSDAVSTFSATRSRRSSAGLFLQNELSLSDDLLLATGVRFDHARYRLHVVGSGSTTRPDFEVWSPRAALNYRLADPLSVYASYARGFRFPNLDEVSGFYGFQPGLVPQKSDSYETGLAWRSRRVRGNLALYWMTVHDEILFNPNAPNPLFPDFPGVNQNFDRTRHRGIELALNARALDDLEVWGSYTLDDARIQRDSATSLDGEPVPITPRHRGTLGVLAFLPGGVEAGLNANLVGRRSVASDLAGRRQALPKFATYDATLALRPAAWRGFDGRLLFAVRNLFDRDYTEFAGDFKGGVPGVIGFYPAPGRRYELVLTIAGRRR